MPRGYELAHIVGISKTPYVLATPRCLDWRGVLQRTSTTSGQGDPDSQPPRRRPAPQRGDRRRRRLCVAGVLVVDGVLAPDGRGTHRRPSRRATWSTRR